MEHRRGLVSRKNIQSTVTREGMLGVSQHKRLLSSHEKIAMKLFVNWETLCNFPNLLAIFILGLVLQAADTSDFKGHKMP